MNDSTKVVVGIFVSLAASAVDAIGLNLQRRDHVRNAMLPDEEQRHECKRLTWHIGFFLYVGSQLFGSSAALYFLQPAVVASLGSAALIFNFIFAYLLVGTRITVKEIIATVFIIIGAALVAVFGDVPKSELSDAQLLELYAAPSFIIYFVILEVITVSTFIFTQGLRKLLQSPAMRAKSKIRILREASLVKMKKFLGLGFAISGGLIASQTVVLAETSVRLIVQTAGGKNEFTEPFPFVLIIVCLITAFSQVYCMNSGLKVCDPVIVVPVFFAFYSTLALFNTNIYYDQWYKYDVLNYCMMLLGIAIIIPGVYIISSASGESGMETAGQETTDEEAAIEDGKSIHSNSGGSTKGEEDDDSVVDAVANDSSMNDLVKLGQSRENLVLPAPILRPRVESRMGTRK